MRLFIFISRYSGILAKIGRPLLFLCLTPLRRRSPVAGLLALELLPEVRRLEDVEDDGAVEHEDAHVGDELHQDELAPENVEGHVGLVSPQASANVVESNQRREFSRVLAGFSVILV